MDWRHEPIKITVYETLLDENWKLKIEKWDINATVVRVVCMYTLIFL